MTTIFLDIETIPTADPAVIAAIAEDVADEIRALTPPANFTKPETIENWRAAKTAELYADIGRRIHNTCFDGGLGRVCCISFAVNDEEPTNCWNTVLDEEEILNTFFYCMREIYNPSNSIKPVFVGHNIANFDLPFLLKRAIVLGIRPPSVIPFRAKPWDESIYDTMVQWAGVKGTISQDRLARVLGLPGKGAMTGADVADMVEDGRIAEVADYCANDVITVREIWRRMTWRASA